MGKGISLRLYYIKGIKGYIMHKLRNQKGSLTVEAALTLPIFICVVISIAFFIKILFVHELIQHAISETANELSTYSYIYSVSGLQKAHDQSVENLDKEKARVEEQLKVLVNTADVFKEFPDEVKNTINDSAQDIQLGNARQAIDDFEELEQSAQELEQSYKEAKGVVQEIINDPKKELKSLACAFARVGMEDLKAELVLKPLTKALIIKHLKNKGADDVNKYLSSLSVVDGFDGLDFSESRLFKDKKHIEMIVRYRVKLSLPINILPEICVIQKAKVRAWLDGDGNQKPERETSVWELPNFERGEKIQQLYGRNLPKTFKTITKFDDKTGIATFIKSIDLNSDTYQQNPKTVEYIVNKCINALADFERNVIKKDENGKTSEYYLSSEQIKQRELIIVIPKGSKNEKFNKTFEQCTGKAGARNVKLVFEEL